jgi:hypothetical protein
MPINIKTNKNIDVFKFFNLDKRKPIILIVSGKEGV